MHLIRFEHKTHTSL